MTSQVLLIKYQALVVATKLVTRPPAVYLIPNQIVRPHHHRHRNTQCLHFCQIYYPVRRLLSEHLLVGNLIKYLLPHLLILEYIKQAIETNDLAIVLYYVLLGQLSDLGWLKLYKLSSHTYLPVMQQALFARAAREIAEKALKGLVVVQATVFSGNQRVSKITNNAKALAEESHAIISHPVGLEQLPHSE